MKRILGFILSSDREVYMAEMYEKNLSLVSYCLQTERFTWKKSNDVRRDFASREHLYYYERERDKI